MRKLNLLLINSVYLVFSSLEMHGRLKQTKVYCKFVGSNWKETTYKLSKEECPCYWYNLLRWMFFIPCDNWNTLFFIKFCRYFKVSFNRHAVAFLFWKEIILCKSDHRQRIHEIHFGAPLKSLGKLLILRAFFGEKRIAAPLLSN